MLAAARTTLLATTLFAMPAAAQSGLTTAPGYHVKVFVTGPSGVSNPDSVMRLGEHIWIGYGNNAAPDGSHGKSNIIEYARDGKVVMNLVVKGHNDGLRFNPYTHRIWALQNEDAIPNMVAINPANGDMQPPADLKTVNGGGYDDMAFIRGQTYISASNPKLNSKGVNDHPAIISLVRAGNGYVPETVLSGNSWAVNTVLDRRARLNLTDPDSMIETPDGNLLMTSQADAELILLRLNGSKGPYVSQIPLVGGAQADDTVFATNRSGKIYVSDTPANTVYELSSGSFPLGQAYSALVPPKGAGYVGALFLDSGATIPVLSGLKSPHGMAFVGH